MEQVAGIEPALSAWQAEVLTAILYLHGISGARAGRALLCTTTPESGAGDRSRICNLLITNQLRCQLRHTGVWSAWWGTIPQPAAWKAATLANWATRAFKWFLFQPCINIIPRFSRKIKFLHTQTYKLKLWFEVTARKACYRKMWPRSYCYTINYLQGPLTQAARGTSEWNRTTDLSGMNRPL